MLLRKQAIKENFTFPPHLTSASPLLGETVDTVSTDVLRASEAQVSLRAVTVVVG